MFPCHSRRFSGSDPVCSIYQGPASPIRSYRREPVAKMCGSLLDLTPVDFNFRGSQLGFRLRLAVPLYGRYFLRWRPYRGTASLRLMNK